MARAATVRHGAQLPEVCWGGEIGQARRRHDPPVDLIVIGSARLPLRAHQIDVVFLPQRPMLVRLSIIGSYWKEARSWPKV